MCKRSELFLDTDTQLSKLNLIPGDTEKRLHNFPFLMHQSSQIVRVMFILLRTSPTYYNINIILTLM